LHPDQIPVALAWLHAVDAEIRRLQAGGAPKGLKNILALKEDKTVGWIEDAKWDGYMKAKVALPGEGDDSRQL